MARPNTVQSEAFFNETIRLIVSASSERVQLQLIIEFLNSVKGYEDEFESYLIQLFQKLPDFSNPLLYAGLHPHHFKQLVHQLEVCIEGNEQFERFDELEQKIFSYKKALAQLYKWVGEHFESEILEEALVVSEKGKQKENLVGVLVPVVEQSGGIKSGRLRRLKVEIIGASKQKFEVKPTFGVIGAEAGSFLEAAEAAAGNLLQESRKGKNKYWIGTAVFDLSHAWHAGRSANLAVAGTFYCEMLRAEELQEYFRLNPAICVTGDVDKTGKVLAVEESTLQQKTEAAFFSWVHILVVPADQLMQTLQLVDTLKSEFPNRELPVVGVTHLRELFFDRRLTLYHKTGAISHNLKKAWKRKFSVAGASLVLVLFLIIGRLVYGPVDRNPTSVEFAGTSMIVKNKAGSTIKIFEVDAQFVEYHEKEPNRPKHALIDVDEDGMSELVYVNYIHRSSENDSLFCFSFSSAELLWKKEISLDLDYSFRPDLLNQKWGISFLKTFENGEERKLFARVNIFHFFTNAIVNIDPKTGELEDMFVNPGAITDYTFKDFNGDGRAELLILASSNAFWGATLIVLDFDNFEGYAPSNKDYKAVNKPYASVIGMVLFPKTIIGKRYSDSKGTYGREFSFNEKTKNVTAHIFETWQGVTSASTDTHPNILYSFDKDLRVISIGSGNGWDILARKYFEDGTLSFEPGLEYLKAFQDSLLWWDGEQFVNEPTLANGYGEGN